MSKRDPRIDPREGDVLRQKNGRCELLVDLVRDGWVYYRVTDGKGGLIAARKMVLKDWCRATTSGRNGEDVEVYVKYRDEVLCYHAALKDIIKNTRG